MIHEKILWLSCIIRPVPYVPIPDDFPWTFLFQTVVMPLFSRFANHIDMNLLVCCMPGSHMHSLSARYISYNAGADIHRGAWRALANFASQVITVACPQDLR